MQRIFQLSLCALGIAAAVQLSACAGPGPQPPRHGSVYDLALYPARAVPGQSVLVLVKVRDSGEALPVAQNVHPGEYEGPRVRFRVSDGILQARSYAGKKEVSGLDIQTGSRAQVFWQLPYDPGVYSIRASYDGWGKTLRIVVP